LVSLDPFTMFAELFKHCISDSNEKDEKMENIIMMLIGLVTSFGTFYLLSYFGLNP
jgi:hypothetical protein